MKALMKYLLREVGINRIIGYKNLLNRYYDCTGKNVMYSNFKSMLRHGYSFESIRQEVLYNISMVKDFAQY